MLILKSQNFWVVETLVLLRLIFCQLSQVGFTTIINPLLSMHLYLCACVCVCVCVCCQRCVLGIEWVQNTLSLLVKLCFARQSSICECAHLCICDVCVCVCSEHEVYILFFLLDVHVMFCVSVCLGDNVTQD